MYGTIELFNTLKTKKSMFGTKMFARSVANSGIFFGTQSEHFFIELCQNESQLLLVCTRRVFFKSSCFHETYTVPTCIFSRCPWRYLSVTNSRSTNQKKGVRVERGKRMSLMCLANITDKRLSYITPSDLFIRLLFFCSST